MAEAINAPSAIKLLKWPLLALVLGLAASTLFVGGGITYLRHEQKNEKISQRNLQEAQARIGNANKEIQDLLASVDIYKRMRERGLFAEEGRLQWIERVAALRSKYQLAELEYDVGPRQIATLPAGEAFPSIEIQSSSIQMRMVALHDGDLMGFINELPRLSTGAFPMDRCSMKLRPALKEAPLAPRIEGQCNFSWITLIDKRPTIPMTSTPQPKTAESAAKP
jgi:hypothetical protein